MFKVEKSRKANKTGLLVATILLAATLVGQPQVAYATEVGDVLYVEEQDNYVQEEITEQDEYQYPADTGNTGNTGSTETGNTGNTGNTGSTETGNTGNTGNTGSTDTGNTGNTGNGTNGDSVADSLEDLDKDQFIDADTPIGDDSTVGDELDKSETEGNEIPEDVKDEVDVKFPETTPTDPEPTDPEPTDPEPTDPEPTDPQPKPEEPDVPKMGDSYTRYLVLGGITGAAAQLLAYLKAEYAKMKNKMGLLGNNPKSGRVVDSKKKFLSKSTGKKLK